MQKLCFWDSLVFNGLLSSVGDLLALLQRSAGSSEDFSQVCLSGMSWRLQVWYGVPAHASEALETAMHDALPHLFEHTPDLLYQLVTLVSPTQLRVSLLL